MTIRIFNTLTGRKEEFRPLQEGRVRMYVCGVTVYDYCHLGHARGALVFDVVRRYLGYAGYAVNYVRNFTDIDDKIIARAGEAGLSAKELAERYIEEYERDMEALGVRPADIEPRATEHIEDIVSLVGGLVKKGKAYVVDGDVYFRVRSFPGYGSLSGRSLDDLKAGARVEVDERKEDPLDFALWKDSKPGEPWWESPWGRGRPGWHIECSAMSASHLGAEFDIHGGGKDLVFPHHENEIAQSVAFSGRPFVRYWMHNGFVNVNQEKMSKSLGNFFTIRDVLGKFDAEAVRAFLLSTHYRSPIDFTDQSLRDVTRALDRFYGLMEETEAAAGAEGGDGSGDEVVNSLPQRFRDAMDDDFNTAVAVGEVFKTVRHLSGLLAAGPLPAALLRRFHGAVGEVGEVLGLFNSSPADWRRRREGREELEREALPQERIETLVAEREKARRERNWPEADRLRDELTGLGVLLEDSAGGTVWRLAKK